MNSKHLCSFLIIAIIGLMAACGSGNTSTKEADSAWSIVADAGKDKNAAPGTSVQVSGEDSIETRQNKTLSYQWSISKKPSDSNAEPPTPANAVNPRSKPDVDGEYELQLDVSVENSTQTETSYVTIVSDGTQRGANVEVDAGKDQFAANNSNVQINQSNDTIIQGDVYYIW